MRSLPFVLLEFRRFAGHSKWANIKHTKAAKDTQRSLLFTKLCQKMKVAVVENGGVSNPEINLRLAQTIEEAKKACMPNATIQNFLKNLDRKNEHTKKFLFGMKGPGSVFILVDTITDNYTFTKNKLSAIIKKFGTVHMESARNLFDHVAVINVRQLDENQTITEDLLTEHAIIASANEVKTLNDQTYQFICEPKLMSSVISNLEKFNCYQIGEYYELYVPKMTVSLTEEYESKIHFMYQKMFNELDEVIDIYDNQSCDS